MRDENVEGVAAGGGVRRRTKGVEAAERDLPGLAAGVQGGGRRQAEALGELEAFLAASPGGVPA